MVYVSAVVSQQRILDIKLPPKFDWKFLLRPVKLSLLEKTESTSRNTVHKFGMAFRMTEVGSRYFYFILSPVACLEANTWGDGFCINVLLTES